MVIMCVIRLHSVGNGNRLSKYLVTMNFFCSNIKLIFHLLKLIAIVLETNLLNICKQERKGGKLQNTREESLKFSIPRIINYQQH